MPQCATSAWAIALLVLMAGTQALACDGEDWVRLEVTAGEMAVDRAAEWIEIDRQGCVLSSYPRWDVRHGLYERRMPEQERSALARLLDRERMVDFDAPAERARIARDVAGRSAEPQTDDLQTIGADTYRLQLFTSGEEKTIVWDAPQTELRLRREWPSVSASEEALAGLARLVIVIETVRRAGDHADKARVEGEQP